MLKKQKVQLHKKPTLISLYKSKPTPTVEQILQAHAMVMTVFALLVCLLLTLIPK